jgi:hypothetical protein
MALSISKINTYRYFAAGTTVVANQTGDIWQGNHVSNQTRAGEGTIVQIARTGFGATDPIKVLKIMVISGSFLNGDTINTNDGGSFDLAIAGTSPTEETIVVGGTMSDTASGSTTAEAVDISETTINVSLYSNIPSGSYIRIDSEYMFVLASNNLATDAIVVKRGLFGSTLATHTTSTAIYIVDTDLYEQLLDADVSGGWGLSTTSNGRIELDAHIMLGRSDNSANAVLITSMESVDVTQTSTNYIWGCGHNTYNTYYSEGQGCFLSDDSRKYDNYSANGSSIISNLISTFRGFTHRSFSSSHRSTSITMSGATFFNSLSIYGLIEPFNAETSKMNDVNVYGGYINFASAYIDMNNINIIYASPTAIYFLYSVGDAEVWGLNVTEGYTAVAGFIASGTKTFVNCSLLVSADIYWGDTTLFINKKTFDCNVVDSFGEPLENVQVKCNYREEATGNIFTVLTDADGIIVQQQIEFHRFLHVDGATYKRYIEYFISKSGYKTVKGRKYIEATDPLIELHDVVLHANRFIEQRSR